MILIGDVLAKIKELPDQSVQCCVTSPPYWGLRDYGVDGQLGLEETPEAFVQKLVGVFAEVKRVLKDDGTLWLNLGDSYAGSGKGPSNSLNKAHHDLEDTHSKIVPDGLKPKDLVGIPWRVAFALQADGWYLRSDIIWHKPNPMPESVTDRPTKSHEYIFLLTKNERYYYDAEAVKEPLAEESWGRMERKQRLIDREGVGTLGKQIQSSVDTTHGYAGLALARGGKTGYNPEGRNKRSVWTVSTHPYPEAHFATYPEDLIKPCILAGTKPGDTVLDPFFGAGTTGVVAQKLGREYIGIELNPEYVQLAQRRLANTPQSLFQTA